MTRPHSHTTRRLLDVPPVHVFRSGHPQARHTSYNLTSRRCLQGSIHGAGGGACGDDGSCRADADAANAGCGAGGGRLCMLGGITCIGALELRLSIALARARLASPDNGRESGHDGRKAEPRDEGREGRLYVSSAPAGADEVEDSAPRERVGRETLRVERGAAWSLSTSALSTLPADTRLASTLATGSFMACPLAAAARAAATST